jgi:hypothetical protein
MYAGNQSNHQLSEKNSAEGFFNRSKATKFTAITIANPTSPTDLIVLNEFIVGFLILHHAPLLPDFSSTAMVKSARPSVKRNRFGLARAGRQWRDQGGGTQWRLKTKGESRLISRF